MIIIQFFCLFVLAIHGGSAWYFAADRAVFLRRALLLVCASWVAENSCIHAYRFYAYSLDWWGFVDQMPVMIAIIWPAVILSSWELARASGAKNSALLTGLLVWADASLIEPIAVKAGLWRWFEPGIFEVPIIGMLGWGIFAALCAWAFEAGQARKSAWLTGLGVLVVAPLLTHVGLLVGWWGFFRWVSVPWSEAWVVSALWVVSGALTVRIWRGGVRERMPFAAMVTRIPAASFFLGLLVMYGMSDWLLVAHALAFVPPYIAATPWAAWRFGRRSLEHKHMAQPL